MGFGFGAVEGRQAPGLTAIPVDDPDVPRVDERDVVTADRRVSQQTGRLGGGVRNNENNQNGEHSPARKSANVHENPLVEVVGNPSLPCISAQGKPLGLES